MLLNFVGVETHILVNLKMPMQDSLAATISFWKSICAFSGDRLRNWKELLMTDWCLLN